MVRKGAITLAVSFAAMMLSLPLGTGPCGPATPAAAVLFYGGGLGFLGGIAVIVFDLLSKFVDKISRI
jgi:hypothetical protein